MHSCINSDMVDACPHCMGYIQMKLNVMHFETDHGPIAIFVDTIGAMLKTGRDGEVDVYCDTFPTGITVKGDYFELAAMWEAFHQEHETDEED